MSEEKKTSLTPNWIMAAGFIVTQLVLVGVFTQRTNDTTAQVVDLQAWRVATERRMSEADKQAAVTAAQVASELRFMNANLDALRRSLESRGIPVQAPTVQNP